MITCSRLTAGNLYHILGRKKPCWRSILYHAWRSTSLIHTLLFDLHVALCLAYSQDIVLTTPNDSSHSRSTSAYTAYFTDAGLPFKSTSYPPNVTLVTVSNNIYIWNYLSFLVIFLRYGINTHQSMFCPWGRLRCTVLQITENSQLWHSYNWILQHQKEAYSILRAPGYWLLLRAVKFVFDKWRTFII